MKISITVSTSTIQYLLLAAFEGGSNYWYRGLRVERGNRAAPMGCHRFHEIPTERGGAVSFLDAEGQRHTLTPSKVKAGLVALYETNPWRFAEILTEDYDAETADVFLQLCVFGRIIYG